LKSNKIIIEAGRIETTYWKDIWKYRELFYFLAWRDVLVRYKQTAIGIIWTLIRPLLTMLVFVFIFGKLAKLPSDDIPYPLLVLSGMLPWLFFANAFSEAGNSLVNNRNIISKIYFPRLIVPLSSVIVSLVEFVISSVILIGIMIYYKSIPSIHILALPIFILMLFAAAIGAGLWVAALNVKYRDFGYVVPFVIQFGLYISPVAFTATLVPEKWKLLYALNPMVGVINGFRWSLLPTSIPLDFFSIAVSSTVIVFLLITGIYHFRSVEKSFADII
jgi:lipopolysaccharide transport system permease protein